jgi:hypothetical protein
MVADDLQLDVAAGGCLLSLPGAVTWLVGPLERGAGVGVAAGVVGSAEEPVQRCQLRVHGRGVDVLVAVAGAEDRQRVLQVALGREEVAGEARLLAKRAQGHCNLQ